MVNPFNINGSGTIKGVYVPIPEGWPGLVKVAEHCFDSPITCSENMNINQALMSAKGGMSVDEYIAMRTVQPGFRPAPVLTKKDYYARYIAGEFGNRLQIWRTCEEYVNSGFTKPIGIRNVKADSPFCRYDIPHRMVMPVVQEFMTKGCPLGDMTFNEGAPDAALIIQGEIVIYNGVLELIYSKVKRQMRIALKEKSEYASGNHAHQILKHCCDVNSYEWMMWQLEAYEDHVVEFSVYNHFLGNIPRRNTLIWEVRKY